MLPSSLTRTQEREIEHVSSAGFKGSSSHYGPVGPDFEETSSATPGCRRMSPVLWAAALLWLKSHVKASGSGGSRLVKITDVCLYKFWRKKAVVEMETLDGVERWRYFEIFHWGDFCLEWLVLLWLQIKLLCEKGFFFHTDKADSLWLTLN